MVKSQDQKLSATKGVGGWRLWGLRIKRGKENGRGKNQKRNPKSYLIAKIIE